MYWMFGFPSFHCELYYFVLLYHISVNHCGGVVGREYLDPEDLNKRSCLEETVKAGSAWNQSGLLLLLSVVFSEL